MKSAAGLFCSLFLLAALVAPGLLGADPVVSNVAFAQRPGTKLVDITYDLEGDAEAEITVAISGDGGMTWAVPATSLTGDVGAGVEPGTGKTIIWDGGADWGGWHAAELVVRVTATVRPPAYLVIDLSGGSAAASYPVSYLDAVPDGGWTDEHKTTKLVLRRIPAGTFTMGSPEGELGRDDDETQHQVTLTKDFYVGVFEVTQRQWERVMDTWPSYFSNAAYRDARPVEQVSWDDIRGGTWPGDPAGSGLPDAATFVGRLRARTGLDLDLPTESQWEYACRAGTATALNSGKDLTDEYDECPNMAEVGRYWHNGGSGHTQAGDTAVGSAKAGSYLPNAWGLYDMHGNVWEWCLDWSAAYPGTVTDPPGAASGSDRSIRGGGWNNEARFSRAASRDVNYPTDQYYGIGFRVSVPMLIPHTVVFDLGEQGTRTGGGALTQQVANGAAAAAPTFTVAPGWTFLGWSAEFAEVTSSLTVTALYVSSPYLVIDLAAGPAAASYPVSYLAAVPEGGWTDEHKTTKLVLRRLQAGIFTMGSPEGELGRSTAETQHQVTLTKDFHIGVFEVTQKQYELVMGTWPSHFNNTTYRDARPVEQVSWDDVRGGTWPGDPAGSGQPAAGTFVQRLRDRTGLDLDLPTESQWEYACRAGTATALNSGKNLTATETCPNMAEVGRYSGNRSSVTPQDGDLSVATAAVGSYLPNAWGLYDLHGNVWEWCMDWRANYPGTVTDPMGPATGSNRVIRGGSWYGGAGGCRSASRISYEPSSLNNNRGFRLAGPAAPDAPAISGTVTGAVRGGVTITLAGLASAQTVTAADGTYAFANLLPGGYTLTASAAGYAFLPATAGVAVGTTDRMGVDFTAQPGSRGDRVVDAETGGVISQADGSGEVSIPGGFLVPGTEGGVQVASMALAAPPFGLAAGAAAVTGTAVLELPGEAIPSATDCDGSFAFHVSSLGQRGGTDPAYCLASVRIEFYMTEDPSVRYSEELFGVPVESGQRGVGDWIVNVSASTMAIVRKRAEQAWDGSAFAMGKAKVWVVATVVTVQGQFTAATDWALNKGIEIHTYHNVRTFIARWDPAAGASGGFVAPTTDDLTGRRVVVLLHGWQALAGVMGGKLFDTAALDPHVTTWQRLARYATGPWADPDADNYVYYTVRYDSDRRIYDSAVAVRRLLAETFPNKRVIILAHSMGGMVAHAMEQQYHPGGTAFAPWPNGGIERIISLNTPYHGTPFVQVIKETADVVGLLGKLPFLKPVGAVVDGTVAFLALATPGTFDLAWDNYDSNPRIQLFYANADLLALNQREPTNLRSRYCTFATTIVSPSRSVVDDAMQYVSGPVVAFMGYANDGIVPRESAHLRGAGGTVRTTEAGASLAHGTYNHFKIYEGAGIDPGNPNSFDVSLYDDILSYLLPEGDYLLIDLAAGPTAESYPVTYLDAVPEGGWTDEHKTTKLVLRRIPAGTFTMGSPTGELGGYNTDDPLDLDQWYCIETQHQVTLTKDFHIGVFEVTQKQYERVMGTWPSHFNNTTYRDARPVELVSWNDIRGGTWPGDPAGSGQPAAGTFVGKLRARTGLDLDLPTESQWEYACRAGTTTALNSNKDLTDKYECSNMAKVGRYWYNCGSVTPQDGDLSVATAAVGSYLPNAWGLYDLHGNVWEWCMDGWVDDLGSSAVTDPLGVASGSFRVMRGGSWGNGARHCRAAYRFRGGPTGRNDFRGGFRVSVPAGRE